MPVAHVPRRLGPGAVRVFPVAADLAENDYYDAGTATIAITATGVEGTTHTGAGTATITLSGSGSGTHVANDSRTATVSLSGSGAESHSHSRSGSATVTLSSGPTSETNINSGVSDSIGVASIEITLLGTGVQSASHTGSGTATITLSGTGTESANHTSVGAGSVTLSGTGAESASHTSSGTTALTLFPLPSYFGAYPGAIYPGGFYPGQTALEDAAHTAADAVSITLSGDGTESYVVGGTIYNDSGTATIFLSGTGVESVGTAPDTIHYTGEDYPVPTLATQINRVRTFLRDWPQIDLLTADIASQSVLTTSVADATIYTPNTVVQIDQEAMIVASGATTVLTFKQRGARGTTAATHTTASPILIRPGFLDQEIIDALNAGTDACYPYIYKEVLDTSLVVATGTYEYTVPYLPSTTVFIPRIWKVEMLVPGDSSYRRIEDWTIARGATPKLKFREVPYPGSTIRVRGYGPFPHTTSVSASQDAQWPASAEQLPALFAASSLLASGEAGRVRNTAGAVDAREQANRAGSSSAAGRDLYQRFKDGLLNGGHMAPMQAHVVVTY